MENLLLVKGSSSPLPGKPSQLEGLLLKFELGLESLVGLIKPQIAELHPSISASVVICLLTSSQMMLMPLV